MLHNMAFQIGKKAKILRNCAVKEASYSPHEDKNVPNNSENLHIGFTL
jgi:hypothetical protein